MKYLRCQHHNETIIVFVQAA